MIDYCRYICKENGVPCSFATEYGYCQITACINTKVNNEKWNKYSSTYKISEE